MVKRLFFRSKTIHSKTCLGFTLVELIVVITILIILGMISFLTIEDYNSYARDSRKIEETSMLYKGVSVAFAKSSIYPEESNMYSISSGSTLLAKQSKIGNNLARVTGISGNLFNSPTNSNDYTYTLSTNGKKAQISSFLEKQRDVSVVIQSGSIAKYLFTRGDNIPVILESASYSPVIQNTDITTATVTAFVGITNTGNTITYSSASDLISNLPVLYSSGFIAETITSNPSSIADCTTSGQVFLATSNYGACNAKDFIICKGTATGYTMAACNLGTSIAGTGTLSYGDFFQWGNNFGFSNTGTITPSTTRINASAYGPGNYYSSSTFIRNSSPTPAPAFDWSNVVNNNLWGGITGTPSARQGPCGSGYHVPSMIELTSATSAKTWANDVEFSNFFLMPLGGFRNYTGPVVSTSYSWNVSAMVPSGFYWSSDSIGGDFAPYITTVDGPAGGNGAKAYGYSIRCFKN